MKLKFMEGTTGKWIKRIVVILLIVGLLAFGAYKMFFNKNNNIEHNVQETLDNLDSYYMEASMEFYKGEIQGRHIDTVFLGGGTPSILTKDEIKKLRKTARKFLDDKSKSNKEKVNILFHWWRLLDWLR